MENEFLALQQRQTADALRACNDVTGTAGLLLTEKQIQTLVAHRSAALRDTGRVEFGEGILKKLILAFYDSPFIERHTYESTLIDLQDSFYYFKNECMDSLSDDELLSLMRAYYDGVCQGSLELLNSTSLTDLCRSARNGFRGETDASWWTGGEEDDDGDE